MTALERAIAERTPLPGLATTSPLHGLRRRSVGSWDVVAQSVAAVAPAGVVLVSPASLGQTAGSFAFLDLAVTVVIIVLLAATISVFARRMASTGSLYTFVTRGLGPTLGIIAGTALALGYAAIAISTLVGASRRTVGLIGRATGDAPPTWILPVVIAVFAILIGSVIVCGLRPSTRIMLVIEIGAVATILALSIVVFISTGWNLGALVPDVSEPFSVSTVLSGVGIALIAFVGFESGTALGPESKRPLATIPRALMWTVIAVGVVYLVGAGAQISGDAAIGGSGVEGELPLARLVESAGFAGAAPLIDLIIALSFLACSLATTTALVRLCFALSREGLLPDVFGRTSMRFGTPAPGAVILTTGVAAVPLVWIVVSGSADGIRSFTTPSAIVGYVGAYVLVCIAAPVFLLKIGEFTWRAALPAILAGTALGAALVHDVASKMATDATGVVIGLAIAIVTATICLVRVRRRPELRAHLGLYDTPVASDSIGGVPAAPKK
ncbi:APC family permease [Agromyces atrinae]|uniref:APC family permease n=1 Tax=Agromyces atrinae TaxID=592376 RepID=UPI001F55E3E1|nr:APC family permease [Agromyces atrinae]MCI2956604.1 APC family permease [Agromyces atrinae]